jgi:4-hydroxy-2-oxoheptanedioate aldolase
MPFVNPLRKLWSSGGTAFGAWCATTSVVSAEAVAVAGYDYVCVDLQHGAVSYSDAVPMLVAIAGRGAAPICRVPANDPGVIGKVLDAGALGVVVPLVSSADEAARAVAACRYPPRGVRSFGPVRAATVIESRNVADLESVICAVMVETREGLDRVDEIAATPGLDVIYVGPADLALALGLAPGYERPEPEHDEAIRTIREACRRHGIVMGIHCDGGEMAARRLGQGVQMATVVNDLALVRAGAAAELALAKAGAKAPEQGSAKAG